MGLFTKNGRALTAKGIKPICPFHQVFQSTYLFGTFSPINGEKFLIELPFCNADTFQKYLNELSKHNPDEFKIMVLDNGAFHKAKTLIIPDSIALFFATFTVQNSIPLRKYGHTLRGLLRIDYSIP